MPATAVAANSSLSAGANTTPSSSRRRAGSLQLEIQPAKWRPFVTAHEGGRVEAPAAVESTLVQDQPYDRLDARHESSAAGAVNVVEAHLGAVPWQRLVGAGLPRCDPLVLWNDLHRFDRAICFPSRHDTTARSGPDVFTPSSNSVWGSEWTYCFDIGEMTQ